MATPIVEEIEALVEQLSEVWAPPKNPIGLPDAVPGSGRWVLERSGGGNYSVRLEYLTTNGVRRVARSAIEVSGYPSTVLTALRFAVGMASATKYQWLPT